MRESSVSATTLPLIARPMAPVLLTIFALLGLFSAEPVSAATVPAPTNLTATMASSRQINLAWTDNATTETNYYVERSPNGTSSWTQIAALGANITSYQNTGLTQSTIYYYRVRCKAGSTYSSYSNTANATTAALAAPTSLTATVASATQITLAWTDNTAFETQYALERSPTGTNPWTAIGSVATNVTTTTNSGLTVGTAYYYRVRAYDSTNYSAYSNTANQTIRTITASAGANGAIAPSGTVGVANGSNKSFTMTPNSGYRIATVTVNGGQVATNPTYTFTNVTSNQTISATFSVSTYTITASAGANGSISPSGSVVVSGGTSTTFTMTPNSGYKIATVTVDGGAVATNPTYTFTNVTAPHTINATFSVNTVTITASAGPNGSITPSGAVAVTLNTNQTFSITPNTSYHISDVSVDGVSVGTPSLYTFPSVTTTHSIVASFAVNTFTINATAGANGSISPSGFVIVNSGATPTFTATPNQGYRILDMKVDGASVGTYPTYTFAPVTANHTIDALFTAQTYTITATANAGGSISPGGAVIVSYGTSTTFAITPNANYHISDVVVDGASIGTPSLYTFPSVTTTHSIIASFAINTFTINASAGANGSISPSGAVVVSAGTSTSFTITPNVNYHISDVSVDGASVGKPSLYTFPSVTATHSILASFAVNTFTITAAAGANGSILPSGAVVVSAGTSTSFAFVPNTGYHISDVVVDGASVGTAPSYTFPAVVSNHTITASFSDTYPITASAGPNGSISPSGTVNLTLNSSQTYTITPNANYHINDVVVDGASVGKVPLYTFPTVTSAHTISASFAADTVISGGTITTNTVWTLAGSPYRVTSYLTVAGTSTIPATLMIEPGVLVKFETVAGLAIGTSTNKGALVSQGTATNHITLTLNGTSGTWYGITFNDATVDAATIIEYTDISNSGTMYMNAASPTIRNSTITNYGGISINGSSFPVITGGSLLNTSPTGNGIYGNGSPSISNYLVSVTSATGNYGIYSSTTTSSLSVTNSTINNGLYIVTPGIMPTISGNTINRADLAPIHAGANIIDLIMDNNTVTGMTPGGKIEVVSEVINRTVQWRKWPAPYVVTGTTNLEVYKDATNAAQLTIDPGAIIKFDSSPRLTIGKGLGQEKGILVAQGTASERITFTSLGSTWKGLTINGASSGTILENVDIVNTNSGTILSSCSPSILYSTITDSNSSGAYAMFLSDASPVLQGVTITGRAADIVTYYGISLLGTASPTIIGGSLSVTSAKGYGIYGQGSPNISNYNISVANNAGNYGIKFAGTLSAMSVVNSTIGNGLYLPAMTSVPTITGNTFTNADISPLHAGANIIDLILDNNIMSGLTANGAIEVGNETITRSPRWKKWAAPYVVKQGNVVVRSDAGDTPTLTLDPGVTVKFGSGAGMMIGGLYSYNRGKLVAQGTAENRIVFTSSETAPAPGKWGSLSFQGSASSASTIEYVTVEYGGTAAYNPTTPYNANMVFDYGAAPIIRNSIIRNSSNSGVFLGSSSGWPTIIDSEISNNHWGVYSQDAVPAVMNSKITGNSTMGVYNASTTKSVDARGNWWGMASGPTYTGNPGGAGDRITDRVLFNPWLGQAPGAGLRTGP